MPNRAHPPPSCLDSADKISALIFLLTLTVGMLIWRVSAQGVEQGFGFFSMPGESDFEVVRDWALSLRTDFSQFLKLSKNNYPPFSMFLFLPFTFVSKSLGFRLFYILLIGAFSASIYLLLGRVAAYATGVPRYLASVVVLSLAFNSYPLIFALERGNSDIIALLGMVLFLTSLEARRPLLAAVLLSLATQLKLYPAILVFLLIYRGHLKSVILFFLLNCGAFLVLGVKALLKFVENAQQRGGEFPGRWNHSIFSFAKYLNEQGWIEADFAKLALCTSGTLFALWATLVMILWLKGRAPASAGSGSDTLNVSEVGLSGAAFCLMSLIPSISHDYKLPIMLAPALLMLGINRETFAQNVGLRRSAYALAFVTAILFLGSTFYPKTPWLFALFLLYCVLAICGSLPITRLGKSSANAKAPG